MRFDKIIRTFVVSVCLLLVVGNEAQAQTDKDPEFIITLPWGSGASHEINVGYGVASHTGADGYAIDFLMNVGTPVYAVAPGTVVGAGLATGPYWGTYGNFVLIEHDPPGYFTLYAHLSSIDGSMVTGAAVDSSTRIGLSGRSGLADDQPDHLHFAMREGAVTVARNSNGYGPTGGTPVKPEPFTQCYRTNAIPTGDPPLYDGRCVSFTNNSVSGWHHSVLHRDAAPPAVIAGQGSRAHVFVTDSDGKLLYCEAFRGVDGQPWCDLEDTGGVFVTAPVAVFNPVSGTAHVFGVGTNGKLFTKVQPNGPDTLGWQDLSGAEGETQYYSRGAPVVSMGPDGVAVVFIRGHDNTLYHRSYQLSADGAEAQGGWTAIPSTQGLVGSQPVAAFIDGKHTVLFNQVDPTDATAQVWLVMVAIDGSAPGGYQQSNVGPAAIGLPSVEVGPPVRIALRDAQNALQVCSITLNGPWSCMAPGGVLTSDPVFRDGSVFVRGSGGTMWEWNASGWSEHATLGPSSSTPTDGLGGLFYSDGDQLCHAVAGQGWSAWECMDIAPSATSAIDVGFLFDCTGSMRDDIALLKPQMHTVLTSLASRTPDFRVAVACFRDAPYWPYGSYSDYTYLAYVGFTDDPEVIDGAIQALYVSGGGDWPEAVFSGIYHMLMADGLGPWRAHATKVIIMLGDAPPHDPEPFWLFLDLADVIAAAGEPAIEIVTGLVDQLVEPWAPIPRSPTPQGIASTTRSVRIFPILVGYDFTAAWYFYQLATRTGGQMFHAGSAYQVVDAILDVITELPVGDTPDDPSGNHAPSCDAASAGSPPPGDDSWPPNHRMQEITIADVDDPDGDPVTLTITGVTQDEPVRGHGSGNFAPDASGLGGDAVEVRVERSGSGDGRVYRIDFTASDDRGGTCQGAVTVCVPRDQGDDSTCVDSGQTYDSTDD